MECTEQPFFTKAGAQRVAASLGLALVTCDTSPRIARYPDDDASWDFGQSASFYVDATREPWRQSNLSVITEALVTRIEETAPRLHSTVIVL